MTDNYRIEMTDVTKKFSGIYVLKNASLKSETRRNSCIDRRKWCRKIYSDENSCGCTSKRWWNNKN